MNLEHSLKLYQEILAKRLISMRRWPILWSASNHQSK